MAAAAGSAYSLSVLRSLAASVLLAASAVVADEGVPLYTNDDLNRMFGPPPSPVTDPVDKSGPEDWGWVEGFLDRQYARIDADRQYENQKRVLDIADERTGLYDDDCYDDDRVYRGYPYYGYGYPSLSLRDPASTWWGNVHRAYTSKGASKPVSGCAKAAPRGRGAAAKR